MASGSPRSCSRCSQVGSVSDTLGGRATALSGHDHLIFSELQRDGRISFTLVAERVGVSEAHVRRRVKWLTDADVFAVTAVADPGVLGLGCMAWIGLYVRPSHIEAVAQSLVLTPGVDYVVVSSGRFNIMCEVACPQPSDLGLILRQLRGIEGVLTTETLSTWRSFINSSSGCRLSNRLTLRTRSFGA